MSRVTNEDNTGIDVCIIWPDAIEYYAKYSVHLETQFFLPPVSPVEGTEIGLTGGRKKTKYKMEV